MTTKSQKIRVGLFGLATLALGAIVLVVFGGMRFWSKRDHYQIEMTDSAYGLEEGAKVYLNGISVGTVKEIRVDERDLQKTIVEIAVKDGTPIRADTKAMLQLAGITGLKVIDLRDGSLAAPALPPGSTIPQGETLLGELEKRARAIADQSTELMTKANQLVDNLVALSDPAGYESILAGARTTSENLAEMSGALRSLVSENRQALRHSIQSIDDTARSASAILDGQVSQLLVNANDVVSGLGGMLRDNQGQLRSALFDLRQASRSFKDLARDVRQRPSRLLFSKPASDRKLP
jgi:phospholipid/cholesterol/gamma-HCH transport system substrate-binding protein